MGARKSSPDANPAAGVYDWSKIDGLITILTDYDKQIGNFVLVLPSVPDLVTKLPGEKTYVTSLVPNPMVLPFDPVVQPKIIAFITALCQHFDDQLDEHPATGGPWLQDRVLHASSLDIGVAMTVSE